MTYFPFSQIFCKSSLSPKTDFLSIIIGILFPLSVFIWLSLEVSRVESGLSWEVSSLLTLHKISNSFLDKLAIISTNFGSFLGIITIILPILFLFSYQKKWQSFSFLTLTILSSAILNAVIKLFFHRVRPHLWEHSYPLPSDFSFPSGHAMGSMTLLMALLILGWGSWWNFLVIIIGSFYMLEISWTRLYLGFHFPSDILAGWSLAIAWTITLSLSLKTSPQKTKS